MRFLILAITGIRDGASGGWTRASGGRGEAGLGRREPGLGRLEARSDVAFWRSCRASRSGGRVGRRVLEVVSGIAFWRCGRASRSGGTSRRGASVELMPGFDAGILPGINSIQGVGRFASSQSQFSQASATAWQSRERNVHCHFLGFGARPTSTCGPQPRRSLYLEPGGSPGGRSLECA